LKNVPELPEVETLRRGLEKKIQGRCIVNTQITNAKILKGQNEEAFCERIYNRRIGNIDRRGKYLLATLENGVGNLTTTNPDMADEPDSAQNANELDHAPVFLCIHLKMRGNLRVQEANEPISPYHCLSLRFDDGKELRYHDMWTWGEVRALTGKEVEAIPGLASMGPEPLEVGWDGTVLSSSIGKRQGPIKPVLLDQKVVAGVGNIYADEALFRAGIHPERSAGTLTAGELDRLATQIRAVLNAAVADGGSMGDYVDEAGSAGRFEPKVYDRGGNPCSICGATLVKIRLGGRGTAFCPTCQPKNGSAVVVEKI
jgi:formamidopyrimidine-DNA glycosylase